MNELHKDVGNAPRVRSSATALLTALLATLVACVSSSPRAAKSDLAAQRPNTQELADASYDWHGLLVAPFGAALKDVPLKLHEVLLFREEARSVVPAGEPECYASDASAPRFVGRTPDEYLLCFQQDRLSRIQASVRLTTSSAPQVFAVACATWMKNAAAATPIAAVPSADACEGRDGAIHFSGRLGEDADTAEVPRAETPQTESSLSIVLDSPPDLQ